MELGHDEEHGARNHAGVEAEQKAAQRRDGGYQCCVHRLQTSQACS
jgi:hypothetical protein